VLLSHQGHNLPDRKGNRYCINLVSIAGTPAGAAAEEKLRSDTA
jgi:peptide methionine sulfoxide reductase MsrB